MVTGFQKLFILLKFEYKCEVLITGITRTTSYKKIKKMALKKKVKKGIEIFYLSNPKELDTKVWSKIFFHECKLAYRKS